jgi:hypothetical protein
MSQLKVIPLDATQYQRRPSKAFSMSHNRQATVIFTLSSHMKPGLCGIM